MSIGRNDMLYEILDWPKHVRTLISSRILLKWGTPMTRKLEFDRFIVAYDFFQGENIFTAMSVEALVHGSSNTEVREEMSFIQLFTSIIHIHWVSFLLIGRQLIEETSVLTWFLHSSVAVDLIVIGGLRSGSVNARRQLLIKCQRSYEQTQRHSRSVPCHWLVVRLIIGCWISAWKIFTSTNSSVHWHRYRGEERRSSLVLHRKEMPFYLHRYWYALYASNQCHWLFHSSVPFRAETWSALVSTVDLDIPSSTAMEGTVLNSSRESIPTRDGC